jgi:capsular polysaccharide transport system permease protein
MVRSVTEQPRKARIGYFWELIDPMIQVGIWFVLFSIIRGPRQIYDMNMFLFLSTGIISLFFFEKVARELPRSGNRLSQYARFTVLNRGDALIAGGLLEVIQMVLVASLLWGAIIATGLGFPPADPLKVLAALACLAVLGFAFGWFNTMVLAFSPVLYSRFLKVLSRVIFITSGAIFPIEHIPPAIFHFLRWNPVYQGVDLVRSAWSHTHDTYTSSYGYVLICAAAFLLSGLLLGKPAERRRAHAEKVSS